MDAFEDLVAMLLRSDGYWTRTGYKVELSKQEKADIGIPTTPRWEIDVLAYLGAENRVLAVECKSFLDSTGVVFRDGVFETPDRYKLFSREPVRNRVLMNLTNQLVEGGFVAPNPDVVLALATGKIARKTNRDGLRQYFEANRWCLFDDEWIRQKLERIEQRGYENDVAHICAKLLLRSPRKNV